MPYLVKDITGAMSRHKYGKKGDEVHIVKKWNQDMYFVMGKAKTGYFVKHEYLSDEKVDADERVELAIDELVHRKVKKTKIEIKTQTLF